MSRQRIEFQSIASQFAIEPLTKKQKEEQRQDLINIRREKEEKKQREFERGQEALEAKRKLSQAQLDAIKRDRCFIAPNGNRICRGSDNLFVSPEQFGKNLDTFIQEDLPKALTGGLIAASLVGGGLVPLAVLAPAVGLSKGLSFTQSGFGITSSKKERSRRRRNR